MTILDAVSDPNLFAPAFEKGDWSALLAAVSGLPMAPAQRKPFRACTASRQPGRSAAREGRVKAPSTVVHVALARVTRRRYAPGMDDKKKLPQKIHDNVPAWVRADPEVLADWLATDWEAEGKLFDEMGGKEKQAVFTGGRRRKTPAG